MTRLLLMLGFVAEERNFLQFGDELDEIEEEEYLER